MVTVTLEYNNNNAVLSGILEAVAKMPDVRIIKKLVPSKSSCIIKNNSFTKVQKYSL